MDEPKLELKVKATGDWEEVRKLLQTLKKGGKLWEGVIAMEAKNAATLVKRNDSETSGDSSLNAGAFGSIQGVQRFG